MLLELHVHTKKYSKCSQIEPVELIRRVMSKKIQGIVITEHHYLWSEEEIRQLRIDAQAEDNFLIMSAEEVDTDKGHILVFGAGYFLAQFHNQFFAFADIRRRFKEEYFLKAYLRESKSVSKNFLREILIFQIRANLSISAYLIKVGKGISPEIDSICRHSLYLKRKLKT